MEKNFLSQNISDITFTFVDVETTGLDPYSGDKICEIAILKSRREKVIDKYETLVNPGRAISPRAVSVNGITSDMVKSSPYFRDIAWEVLEFLTDSVAVAHNAPFDFGFLSSEFTHLRLSPPSNEVIDTLSIARRYFSFPSNSLGKIARYLGISSFREHRAYGDVQITKGIFEYFLMDLSRRGIRIQRLKDILKLQGGSVAFEKSSELVVPPDIEEALRNRSRLQIRYLSAYKEATTIRIIEPLELMVSGSYTYIVAFCHLRKDKCSFRLDRILEVKSVS